MALEQTICRKRMGEPNLAMIYLMLTIIVAQVLSVTSIYLPKSYVNSPIMRRQDMDEDEMDQDASAPYQDQDSGSNTGGDGYEDNDAGKLVDITSVYH